MPSEFRDSPDGEPELVGASDNTGNGVGAFDPANAAAPSEPSGPAPKRRGRPPGSGGKPTGAKSGKAAVSSLDLSSITGLFVGIHAGLAMATGAPELMISEQEGKQFMTSVQNVMRHYDVQTTQKTMDYIALFGTAGSIYLPRMFAIWDRKQSENRPPKFVRRPPEPQPVQHPQQENFVPSVPAGDIIMDE